MKLKKARLFGYNRPGSRIDDRFAKTEEVLLSEGCAIEGERDCYFEYIDEDVDEILIDRIYS